MSLLENHFRSGTRPAPRRTLSLVRSRCELNFSVFAFSGYFPHDLFRGAVRKLRLYLKRHLDVCPKLSAEVLNDRIGDLINVTLQAQWVQRHSSMKTHEGCYDLGVDGRSVLIKPDVARSQVGVEPPEGEEPGGEGQLDVGTGPW
jgi:hypothetical protein